MIFEEHFITKYPNIQIYKLNDGNIKFKKTKWNMYFFQSMSIRTDESNATISMMKNNLNTMNVYRQFSNSISE